MSDDQEKVTDWEWSHRILCSDEDCIGVIGPDGRCKECGKSYEGQLPLDSAERPEADARDPVEPLEAPEIDDDAELQDRPADDDEWARRRLCGDEDCIGVIGTDGRCKECGKKAEGD